jgi:hypothetical protein
MHRLRALLLLPLALSFAVACGDSTGPSAASVAGTYHATRLDLTSPSGTLLVDAIALGASVDLVLTPQGTTTGTLVIPAVLTEDGQNEEILDLAGTFTVTGNTVSFQGQGDNIIPAMTWTIGNGTLTASSTNTQGTTNVTLTRS